MTDNELLALCAHAIEAQHNAIDLLLANLLLANPAFRPSQSGAWPAVITGYQALALLRCRVPEAFSHETDRSSRN